jgi:hypothetical protein
MGIDRIPALVWGELCRFGGCCRHRIKDLDTLRFEICRAKGTGHLNHYLHFTAFFGCLKYAHILLGISESSMQMRSFHVRIKLIFENMRGTFSEGKHTLSVHVFGIV